jgi:GTP-binding protein
MVDEYRQVVFADIPGLIRGAHEGQGLGHKFLRHIERTRILVHMVDLDPHSGRDPVEDFHHINQELEAFNPALLKKPQIIVANKIDLEGADEQLEALKKGLANQDLTVFSVSAMNIINTDTLLNEILTQMDLLDGRTPGKLTWEGP